jgi:hypothetical protein
MSLDYLKRLLDRNGIDGWSLQTLAPTDRGDVLWMTSTGAQKAAELWRRLRGVAAESGHWPVILGDAAHAAAAMRDQLSSAAPASEVLRAASAIDAAALLRKLRDERLEDLSENNEGSDPAEFQPPIGDWPAAVKRRTQFLALFDTGTRKAFAKAAIALVPTPRGWEAPAFLNFGGWNACPQPAEHCAVLAYWNGRFGADVASMTRDVIELEVARPPASRDEALALAHEQFDYCEDIVDQGVGTISNLAADLLAGSPWYFWWD